MDDEDNFEELLTGEVVGLNRFVLTLLSQGSGWMRQTGHLKDRLVEIKAHPNDRDPDPDPENPEATHLLSEQTIKRAKTNWKNACETAHEKYATSVKNHEKRAKVSRDSHVSIKPILSHENPGLALSMMIAGVQGELAVLDPEGTAWAETLRDLVATQLNAQIGFRTRTFVAQNWKADNSGHLQWDGKAFWLRMSHKLFKNKYGPYFRAEGTRKGKGGYRDYEMELLDIDGFYENLRLYLTVARPRILKDRKSDALFVTRGKHIRITSGALDQLSRRLYNRHLVFNAMRNTGFPGIYCSGGWHSWRHIIATATWMATGSALLAAGALQDSEEMIVGVYGQYLPKDRQKELLEARRAYLAPPSGDEGKSAGAA
jgi:hypothetical protein